jgi:hypothetical protein
LSILESQRRRIHRAGLRDVDDVGGVPKLEGKKNYKTWELRIRTLLDSKDEWAAAKYSPV